MKAVFYLVAVSVKVYLPKKKVCVLLMASVVALWVVDDRCVGISGRWPYIKEVCLFDERPNHIDLARQLSTANANKRYGRRYYKYQTIENDVQMQ